MPIPLAQPGAQEIHIEKGMSESQWIIRADSQYVKRWQSVRCKMHGDVLPIMLGTGQFLADDFGADEPSRITILPTGDIGRPDAYILLRHSH
jgi:hypothetical protein